MALTSRCLKSTRSLWNVPLEYCSVTKLCPNLQDTMDHSTPSIYILPCIPEFAQLMSIESVMPSNHLIPCHLLLLLPSVFPSIRVFFPMSQLFASGGENIGVSASASGLSNEYSGLISFRIDWFDLLAVQGIQESSPTPQFKSSNSSALSFLYGPTLTSTHDYWKNYGFD